MQIRPFKDSDSLAVQELLAQLTGHSENIKVILNRFDFFRNHTNEWLYIAEIEDTVVGLFSFRIRENVEDSTHYGEVSLLVTSEQHRHKGIATKLMKFAEQLARQKNCIGLWLVSGFGREEQAHSFYKHYGFEITGYRFVKNFDITN